jgi:RNA-dependent RNA polymerase
MNKFSANPPYFLEIAKAFTNSSNCFLSRQLIKILEDLEVPIQVFLDLQKNCVDETLEAAKNLISTSYLLETYSLGNSFGLQSLFQNLVQVLNLKMEDVCGLDGIKGFNRIVEYSIYEILRDLKHRSRIPVKGSYNLVGIADEWNHLKECEIFACAYDPVTGKTDYLKGSICISKAPCLHPGDVQMVQAIGESDVPGLMSIRNAVVFSAKSDQNQR